MTSSVLSPTTSLDRRLRLTARTSTPDHGPTKSYRYAIDEDRYRWLQEQSLCPEIDFSFDIDEITGQILRYLMTPRCRKIAHCAACAGVAVRKLIRASDQVAKPDTAITVTELLPRQTSDDKVWHEAQKACASIRTHLARRAKPAPEWLLVIQRGHRNGMIHAHMSAHQWKPAHTTALREITTKRGIQQVKVERITGGWSSYLFAEVLSGGHAEHVRLNNAPNALRHRLHHHTRNFYRGMTEEAAMAASRTAVRA